ncbi:nitroreductase family protein [Cyanobium sp. CH-040]|nr:nitroreductase family protein [Cyanobium sp. CH-040]
MWRHAEPGSPDASAVLRALVHDATLAPSSHNTQCWRFRLEDSAITLLPDAQRRCPVVDPDDHHLFVSLGCAAESLVHSALAHGWLCEPVFHGGADPSLRLALLPTVALRTPLFEAIPHRQTTRADFDAQPLSTEELKLLEAAGSGPGVQVHLLTGRQAIEAVGEFVVEANTAQLRNQAFVAELRHWIRFNGREAVRTGDGLFSACTGNPGLPTWLGRALFPLVLSERKENERYTRQIRSSAGIAVFVSQRDDQRHWIEAGRAFQRFALQATALGVRTSHLNQPVEVAPIRAGFARFLGVAGGRPDLVIRFGRGPVMPRSLRRPVDAVLV